MRVVQKHVKSIGLSVEYHPRIMSLIDILYMYHDVPVSILEYLHSHDDDDNDDDDGYDDVDDDVDDDDGDDDDDDDDSDDDDHDDDDNSKFRRAPYYNMK